MFVKIFRLATSENKGLSKRIKNDVWIKITKKKQKTKTTKKKHIENIPD